MEEDQRHTRELAELIVDVLSDRYGVDPAEAVEVFQWARAQRKMMQKMQIGVIMTIISMVVGGAVLALWSGFKQFAHL